MQQRMDGHDEAYSTLRTYAMANFKKLFKAKKHARGVFAPEEGGGGGGATHGTHVTALVRAIESHSAPGAAAAQGDHHEELAMLGQQVSALQAQLATARAEVASLRERVQSFASLELTVSIIFHRTSLVGLNRYALSTCAGSCSSPHCTCHHCSVGCCRSSGSQSGGASGSH